MYGLKLNPVIVCNDGTELSVQASSFHYSSPKNNEGPYTEYEVSLTVEPNEKWGNGDGVYGYVSKLLVLEYIVEHGGIKEGRLP